MGLNTNIKLNKKQHINFNIKTEEKQDQVIIPDNIKPLIEKSVQNNNNNITPINNNKFLIKELQTGLGGLNQLNLIIKSKKKDKNIRLILN